MLTRLYIDNFRCFVNFEFRPGRKQVIIGRNGAGKSSLIDALLLTRDFVVRGNRLDDYPILSQRTRWLKTPEQTCEIEASLDGATYVYRLVTEPWGDPVQPRVFSETIDLNGRRVLEFTGGTVKLYHNGSDHPVVYPPLDRQRSALATIGLQNNPELSRFLKWIAGLACFRINPFAMGQRAEKEDIFPQVDCSNFSAWYRHLVQAYPGENAAFLESIREAVDEFRLLRLEDVGEHIRLLTAEFSALGRNAIRFGFNELSEGQRCLIGLYAILHFVVANASTVILDEPENFVALREIQPWLTKVTDVVDDGFGQVLIISHHPEIINQWVPGYGVEFVREDGGPVRVREFQGEPDSELSPAELIARGWENG